MIGSSVMKTLRFSRTVKREVQGQDMAIALVLEIVVPVSYDETKATIDLEEKDGGRLTIGLKPEPPVYEILSAAAGQAEITAQATETSVLDLDALIAADLDRAEERAVELVAPEVTPDPSRKAALMGGAPQTPFTLGITQMDVRAATRAEDRRRRRLAAAKE